MSTTTTQKHVLPYEFIVLDNHTVRIINTNRQTLKVTRAEIENQLQRDDIDPHRRRMYEGAINALDNKAR